MMMPSYSVGSCLAVALFVSGCSSSGPSSAAAAGSAGAAGMADGAGQSGQSATAGSSGSGVDSGGTPGSGGAAGALGVGGAAGAPSSRQTAKPIGGANTAPNGFYEYLPPNYDGKTPTPLLVFWHGIGQDGNGGSDLPNVLYGGPPELISKDHWDNQRPFIVLSPQYTGTNAEIAVGGGCPSSAVIDAFFKWAVLNYAVDPKRVYLTGLSCGAIGSWDYLAQKRAELVAAAVVMSGNPGDPAQAGSAWQRDGCGLGDVAIWSLHGDKDDVVPYAPDHDTLTKLIACPSPPRAAAVFTDVVNGGHLIWDPIYDLSGGYGDIYAWLLMNAKR